MVLFAEFCWDTSGNFQPGIMSDWLAFCATENLDSLEKLCLLCKIFMKNFKENFKENKLIKADYFRRTLFL